MSINRENIDGWKKDVNDSVDYYNRWFLQFAPLTFREERKKSVMRVRDVFKLTNNGRLLSTLDLLKKSDLLPILRQMTCPPLARDRLAGLAGVPPSYLKSIEEGAVSYSDLATQRASKVIGVLRQLMDVDLLPWLSSSGAKFDTSVQRNRSAIVVADRLCGAMSDPIIRNAQERRQLKAIAGLLNDKGYVHKHVSSFQGLQPGEFAFHLNIKVLHEGGSGSGVNIPVDVAIQPRSAHAGDSPIIIEAKSAGDFANVNKRRKEEAQKIAQLKRTYGSVKFYLFLCGYFDAGYLGYEAAEGIDWVWEHRLSDMEKLGL